MSDPNPLQVPEGAGVRYSGTKVTAATLGTVALLRIVAGRLGWDLPITDEELLALGGLLVAAVHYFLRRAIE